MHTNYLDPALIRRPLPVDIGHEENLMFATLLVVRHLQTHDNALKRFSTGDTNAPLLSGQVLSDDLIRQIEQLGSGILLCHTGLTRTEETARIVAKHARHADRTIVVPELRERIGGLLAGIQFKDLQRRFPDIRQPSDHWKINAPHLGLETIENFLARIEAGLKFLATHALNKVLVAHAGTIKGIQALIQGKTLDEQRAILLGPSPDNGKAQSFYFWIGE